MNMTQRYLGFGLLIATLIVGLLLKTEDLFFRLLIGVGFGYVLTRSFMGFAGSVNRAYRGGSTQLMQVLMVMFVVAAIVHVGLFWGRDINEFKLNIYPINFGLIIGGLLFGFGMTFSSCCGSGTLTDIATDIPRGGTTLFFFGLGVFLGFPFQNYHNWVKESWFTTSSSTRGVFLPDLFKFDGLNGYLGAIVTTALLAGIVIHFAKKYEEYRRNTGSFSGIDTEEMQATTQRNESNQVPYRLFSQTTYETLFVKPWSMTAGAMGLVILVAVLMSGAKTGWSVTSPFGIWFGKLLGLFGVSPDALAKFTGLGVSSFTTPVFEQAGSIQNFGIIIGTITCLLLMGSFKFEFGYSKKQLLIFAVGGFLMGFGTRLAHGCNAGALFTPISQMSLSGWFFLVVMIAGGILGNQLRQKIY